MTHHARRLNALLRITGIKVIHDLASDMEAIDGRSHYAEIAQVVFNS